MESPKNLNTTERKNDIALNLEEVEMSPLQRDSLNNNYLSELPFLKENSNGNINLIGKSFWLLDKNNAFRLFLHQMISHKYFDRFIILTILFSCIMLLARDPFEETNSVFNQILIITDYVILAIYFLELLMRALVYGFLLNGPRSFLRNFSSFLDFSLLVLTFIGTLDESMSFSQVNLKPFRVFRFARLIYEVKESRKSMKILLLSIPELVSVFFYFALNLLFFGIISMKYFKHTFFYCTTLEEEILDAIIDKWDCFDYGGDWINQDTNFDNIWMAVSALFQLCTTEGWMRIM